MASFHCERIFEVVKHVMMSCLKYEEAYSGKCLISSYEIPDRPAAEPLGRDLIVLFHSSSEGGESTSGNLIRCKVV